MSRKPEHIKTISQYHNVRGLRKPLHPLISIVDYSQVSIPNEDKHKSWIYDFYLIAVKRSSDPAFKMKYGQNKYDYDEGIMFFMSPGQILSIEGNENRSFQKSGWMLLIHPDFLFGTPLVKTIKSYEYFKYSTHEALFLSEQEEQALSGIITNIKQEYQSVIDKHSQHIIVSQIDTLLAYSNRFYERQFITRKPMNHHVLEKFEEIINEYFRNENFIEDGMLSVTDIASQLDLTPNYLSSVLKHLTGQSTQYYIHHKVIEIAKEKLSVTDLSVSQIAYQLGFDYPQSFSKLFKIKTGVTPSIFRQSYNRH